VAEASAVALGRYLRTLRERRGLSLGRVCELTKNTPEPIDKGTLSRLEHGQQTPSIYRLGPLSRIYAISADALLERMELDREVDRLEGPETHGKSYEDLFAAGVASVRRGNRKWHTYAYFRDALTIAPPEKRTVAAINLATTIRSLGKNALAVHELRELELTGDLDDGQRAVLHERIATCCRCMGDMRGAEEYAESATVKALALGDARTLAYAYCTRACVAIEQERWAPAYDDLLKALAAYRAGEAQRSQLEPNPAYEAHALLMLAECSLHVSNLARARRLTLSARHLSEQHDLALGLAYSELVLGWIDERTGNVEQALVRWRKAATLAARIDYPRYVFTAEVEIFRQALEAGDKARARASRRRLERIAPWIPQHIPAARQFKRLIDRGGSHEERSKNSDLRAAGGDGVPAGPRRAGRVRATPVLDQRVTPGSD
jgi:transcriptional regulator with XRE-family HTH domain